MSGNPIIQTERRIPTRKEAAIFRFKTALLQGRRLVQDRTSLRVKRFAGGTDLKNAESVGRSVTPLWTETDHVERLLLAGKVQNLRLAVARLNGIEVPAGETFSFWRHVGRSTRRRGFVGGRELREGCIIPNIGGGLCQISNALYDAALQANFEIVERHRHTQVVAGSLAELDRDATVFWNYVDLRFRSVSAFRIEARLNGDSLIVELKGKKTKEKELHQIRPREAEAAEVGSCATCEVGDCHRVIKPAAGRGVGVSAWLVDEFMPEFDDFIQLERSSDDLLCIPVNGTRFRKANYAWDMEGFGKVNESLYITAVRSYRSRKLAAQGPARQRNLLAMYEALADSYAKRLTYDCLHVTVQQNLLPFLWRSGHLGGRTFDVLMNALPMHEIQMRLDRAAESHPESTTLADFRADEELIAAESAALATARRIVTPHTAIASLFLDRAVLLDWKKPDAPVSHHRKPHRPTLVFPASTVGRKGCYELRDAVRGRDVKLIVLGPTIEGANFWEGFEVERGSNDWLERADVVVLPAFVEHKPRRLLAAIAAGIPVIATPECGVTGLSGVITIPTGSSDDLRRAIFDQCLRTQK